MMPELGNFLLCLAAGLALLLSVYPVGRGAAGSAADGPGPAAGLWAIRLYRRRLPAAGARLCGQ
ncbi:hypothetical protein LN650_13775 [Klebsiella pneumoniae subsp. pneumoniae]|nr:hypothetical protein [Klebsiella pneumoniae subsp. pneumoniae]